MAKKITPKHSKDFLHRTVEVWQPYFPVPLTLGDAREITQNMTALFNFLIAHEDKPEETK